jgi:hypothetical protein
MDDTLKPSRPWFLGLLLALAPAALAQEAYKVEKGAGAVPDGLPAEIAGALAPESFRIVKPDGQPLAELWLRKAVPARSEPSGPEGAVLYPFLVTGELLGVVKYEAEGYDYRDQAIVPGVYTIRYGIHPVNGDHLGVSPFRDYGLLLPAASEKSAARLNPKDLERGSAEAAGTNHPAVLLMTAVEGTPPEGVVRDEAKGFWGLALPLTLEVDEEPLAEPFRVGLIFDGVAAQ